MPVPKRKTSKSRRDLRSSTKFIRPKAVAQCQTCQEPIAPHVVCKACGYYKGVKILKTKEDRMFARGKQRDAKAASARAGEALAGSESEDSEK